VNGAPPLIPQAGPARPVLLGFSGGLDSTVLLHLLAAAPGLHDGLRAIHVHHGLHAGADAWVAHCRAACRAAGIPLQVVHVDVERDGGHGLEAAARAARHQAFAAQLRDDEVLALAHHRDDQAETFLLRALRASGPDGLAAMRPWRRHAGGWLWRPLLETPRAALLAHARAGGLAWIDDPSNADPRFDRNYLRTRVMPLLRERWPSADAAFANSAGLCAEAVSLLADDDAGAVAAAATDDAAVLDVRSLAALPRSRRARVLRHWIASLGLPPLPASGIAVVETDLLGGRADARAEFAWSGTRLRRWRDGLHAEPDGGRLPEGWQCEWDGATPLRMPDGSVLALRGAERFAATLRVHGRNGGERITLPGRSHSHALKHVLQEAGVPPWRRERLPLLSSSDGTLLAAGDRVVSGALAAWLQANAAHLHWTQAPR
jgi:tRNA(Ile)-lysidine synthase